MHPYLALCIYLICLLCVLYFDRKRVRGLSAALWLPLFWFLIIGSRNLSQWISGTPADIQAEYMEGNTTDRTVFLMLILVGLVILARRRIDWGQLLRKNGMIVAFFVYCGISFLWSDHPTLAFKRWVKGTGDYIMVLVVLTEAFPLEAVKTIIRRAAYILVPGSIIMIKYFPGGRVFTPWGQSEFVGVATSKNMLGTLYLIFGLYFFWSIYSRQHGKGTPSDREELYLHLAYLLMIGWLYWRAPGLTSLLCLVTGALLVYCLNMSVIVNNPKNVGRLFLFFTYLLVMLQLSANWLPKLVTSFGRDPSLTGRVPLWKDLLSIEISPVLGAGYETFWVGSRLERIWDTNWWLPNQAHNGFIEIYLNLGWIGLFFILAILYTSYRKIISGFQDNYAFSVLRMSILFVMILYSQTEAAFKGLHKMWFLFLLIAMEYRKFTDPRDLQPGEIRT